MKILSATVTNFASYRELTFEFTDKGLTLISGPTGAGKSTLCDIPPWILFGKTAKGGAVDEIRSWNSSEDTTGSISVMVGDQMIQVQRKRGRDNDLIFHMDGGAVRGKDIADTQKRLNQVLGMDAELYLSGAYFHEFSQTAQFFTAPAKARRQIIEQMVDLTLAKDVTEANKQRQKQFKSIQAELQTERSKQIFHINYLTKSIPTGEDRLQTWETGRGEQIAALEKLKYNFNNDKAARIKAIKKEHLEKRVTLEYDISSLEKDIQPPEYYAARHSALATREAMLGTDKCNECGAPKHNAQRLVITKDRYDLTRETEANEARKIQLTRLQNSLNKHLLALEPLVNAENARTNTYVDQIKSLRREKNPHFNSLEAHRAELIKTEEDRKSTNLNLEDCAIELADLDLLQVSTEEFRARLIESTVSELQSRVNEMLETHFDAELRVVFTAEEADKLNVLIYKDGNSAVYSQLSKGQRQLLKLTFGLAVMRVVANHRGLSFNAVFLDEAFDGLSDLLKVKACGLLQGLAIEHESVFCVEHNESLKGLFPTRVDVALINGQSEVTFA